MRESTLARVEAAIKELNYRPNQAARDLASQRAHLIGLIYDDPSGYEIPSSGFIISMQQGTLRACRAAHYELLIHPCNYRSKGLNSEISELIAQARPKGIVLAAPLSNMPRVVQAIRSTNTPFVRLSPGESRGVEPCVATNDAEISAEMTQYLASLGHRRIAFIAGHESHKAVANRLTGYEAGLKESKLRFSERLVVAGDNSFKSGVAAAEKLLRRKKRPSAIFAANDDMAAGALRVARRLGIDVPNELSIAGFDDGALARQVFPKLTTIRQPLDAMAERAASMLIDSRGDVERTNGAEVIPACIKVRESTGPAMD